MTFKGLDVGHSPRTHSSLAFAQLRNSVAACCWIVGLALLVQIVTWSLVSFTDLRYASVEVSEPDETPRVVDAEAKRRETLREAAAGPQTDVTHDVNRQLSVYDRVFSLQMDIAAGAGMIAVIALLPFLAVGVVLAAGSATPGVERAVSAFVWAVILSVLVIPIGVLIESLPFNGVFLRYEKLVGDIARYQASNDLGLIFYGRYLVLPLACMCGIALVGLRFRAAVEAGLIRENWQIDPELEAEASNVLADNLVAGGRNSGALRVAERRQEADRPLTAVSPGDPEKRPI